MKKHLLVSSIVLLSVLAIVSCSSRHIEEKPDTTIPTILSTSPASNASAVAVTTSVTCTFSEAMNASTINDTSFLLTSVTSTASTRVVGTVTYESSSKVATFTPTATLEHNSVYTATITPVVTDAAGNKISASFSWSFTTIPAPGTLDATFGIGGKVRTALGLSNDAAFAAAIQQDGKIVTAGYSTLTSTTTNTTTIDYYFTIVRYQSSGALDTTFGFTQNGWSDDIVGTARAVELQPDGKIVAAGDSGATTTITAVTTTIATTITTTLSNSDFLIARYNAHGTLDPTFGLHANGTVAMDMGYDHDVVRSLAIQSDGKIVVVGDGINSSSPNYVSIIARFNTDGTLDMSFANGGIITDTSRTTSRVSVVKMQQDGKIVVGGNFQNGSGPASFYLARYDSNGAPDTSFNSGTVTASPGADPVLADIAILPNGKIIVAGTTNVNSNADVFLMRYNADGTLDTTFGSTGTVIADDMIHGRETTAGLAVQTTDGKIVVSATFQPSAGSILTDDFALFRYNADGSLDTTFGNGFGMVTTDLGSANDDVAYDVQIQQDGNIVVVGAASNGSNDDIGLARYWP
jgi:uncharacterized delta-60 repeat protein